MTCIRGCRKELEPWASQLKWKKKRTAIFISIFHQYDVAFFITVHCSSALLISTVYQHCSSASFISIMQFMHTPPIPHRTSISCTISPDISSTCWGDSSYSGTHHISPLMFCFLIRQLVQNVRIKDQLPASASSFTMQFPGTVQICCIQAVQATDAYILHCTAVHCICKWFYKSAAHTLWNRACYCCIFGSAITEIDR